MLDIVVSFKVFYFCINRSHPLLGRRTQEENKKASTSISNRIQRPPPDDSYHADQTLRQYTFLISRTDVNADIAY